MQKIKFFLSCFIAWIPLNILRIILYKVIGYKIGRNVSIGIGTILCCNCCIIGDNVKISRNNKFRVKNLKIGNETRIGSNNIFEGDASFSVNSKYANAIIVGENCLITNGHLLDGSFGIKIGNQTWIAGRGTSFWSHGSTRKNNSIIIGNHCYIGSESRFGTDLAIGDNVLVAMGSIVLRTFPSNCTIAGSPAAIKRENYLWYEHWA